MFPSDCILVQYEQEHSISRKLFAHLAPTKPVIIKPDALSRNLFTLGQDQPPPPINNIMDNLASLQPNSKQHFTIFQLLLILISYFWPASAPFNWLKWRHATPSVTKFKANLKRRFFFLLHLAMIRIDFLNNIALLTPNMSLAQKLKCGLLVGKRRLTSHEDVC